MSFDKIQVPVDGEKITVNADNSLNVPDMPIIQFIEGDGIGDGASKAKKVTYDLERLMDGATLLSSSESGDAMIENMA